MSQLVFVRTFSDFEDGLNTLRQCCMPAHDAVEYALNQPVLGKVAWGASKQSLLENLLLSLSRTMSRVSAEYAEKQGASFKYRTKGMCVFGWHEFLLWPNTPLAVPVRRYNFYARVDLFAISRHREEMARKFWRAGWEQVDVARSRRYIPGVRL
jgi:hypothetical protein